MLKGDASKFLGILRVLRSSGRAMTSSAILEGLRDLGIEMSDRTVRSYLVEMDRSGLTQNVGKKGRCITELGIKELESFNVIEKVGFLSSKIDNLTYLMDFNLNDRSGSVIINISLVDPEDLMRHVGLVSGVFERGYGMGHLISLFYPKEQVGGIEIPEGKVGVGTVCSITLNGVLLKYGIPVHSKFGGLLELKGGIASRFLEIIYYDGTTIDPLEIFIRSGMTDYIGAVKSGNGKIGAGFREFPAKSRALVEEIAKRLQRIGLGGFLKIGLPGRPLLDIPVGEGRIGAIVIGGLNPIAILEECGSRTYSKALAALVEYSKLFHYSELESRLKEAL